MHQTRMQSSLRLPIRRKGTKYIARASSDLKNSVPVVIAVRDMLKMARNAKEVKAMIKAKALKINGKDVKDYRESIKIFNIFEADKSYVLSLLPSGKFTFEKADKKERLCKITNKKLLPGNKIQINFHDGSNLITNEKVNVEDSVYLNFQGKIVKHLPLEKGKPIFIISGKYIGLKGKVEAINSKLITVKIGENEPVALKASQIIIT